MKTSYEIIGCPVCGSQAMSQVADQADIQDEVADLWMFHTRRMRPTTDPKDLTDRVAFSQAPPIRVAQCSDCTHIFRNPRERGITSLYGAEDVDEATYDVLFEAQRETFDRQIARLNEVMPTRGNGLEVGSYVGAFLDAARAAGWQFEGCDVNPDAVAFARGKGLIAHDGSIDDIAQMTPGARFDVVAIWNCFEQLSDVRATIRTAHSMLHESGVLTIRVPNAEYWASMRTHRSGPAGYVATAALAQNNLLSFPYRNGFTPRSLNILCERNGFEIVQSFGEFSLPVSNAGSPKWALMEGHAVHRIVQTLRGVTGAPWMEVYARKAA